MRILTILYGSQTGTAEEIGIELEAAAKEKGMEVERYECDEGLKKIMLWSEEQQSSRVFVLLISSTGDGEPPDNCRKFWKELRVKKKKSTKVKEF